jgi:hypothetical protein
MKWGPLQYMRSKHMCLEFNTDLKYSDSTAPLTFRSFDTFVSGGMDSVSVGSGLSQTQNPRHLIYRPLNPCWVKTTKLLRGAF